MHAYIYIYSSKGNRISLLSDILRTKSNKKEG